LWIDLRQEGDAADERLTSTLTDEADGFVFAGLGAGRYVLAVRDSISNETIGEVVVPLARDRTVRIALPPKELERDAGAEALDVGEGDPEHGQRLEQPRVP